MTGCRAHRGYVGAVSTREPDGRVTEDVCPRCDDEQATDEPVSPEYQRKVDQRLAARRIAQNPQAWPAMA